ncbi:MAG TPA: hypothetical protein VF185_02825 [Patescibacteria group bacterium]
MTKKIAVLGAGEIGSSIKKIAEVVGYKVFVRELKYDEINGEGVEALHVCIPYKGEQFIDFVSKAVKDSKAKIVIIHGTVPPGITNKLAKRIKIPTANSPVRGNHPDLYKSIKSEFVKYVGGVDKKSTRLAIKHLRDLGIKHVEDGGSAINTELGKMVNILGYAWSIIFCKWVDQMCKDYKADFDVVYTKFTESYNDGYKKTRPNVHQPILKPVKGPIGGHCVIADTILLEQVYKSSIGKFILQKDKEYKKEV